MYLIILISSVTILLLRVKNQAKKRQEQRRQIAQLAERLLDRQIEILGKGDYRLVTMELEIAKYLKDCLILKIADGCFEPSDIWKAHKWLRDEFEEEFQQIL